MSVAPQGDVQQNADTTEQNAGLQAALARTATRGMALYFSRPVRLFRPSKISGWQSLKSLAEHQGAIYDYKFLLAVVKLQGFGVFSKHFLPPMAVNAMLGTVLWTTYAEAYSIIEPNMRNHPIMGATLAGGIAGGVQALVAAPAENLRLAIEGGTSGHSWIQAWKSMMHNNLAPQGDSRMSQLRNAREVRKWMREVGEMAGRGWNGWGWGCAKDVSAFSAFFAIFEVTRRLGQATKSHTEDFIAYVDRSEAGFVSISQHLPRVLNSAILVSGGVIDGHNSEVPKAPEPKAAPPVTFAVTESSAGGKETFSSAPTKTLSQVDPELLKPAPIIEEEDDLSIPVAPGTTCRRKGCGIPFASDEENRKGDGPGTICIYHPAPPIFREGSKVIIVTTTDTVVSQLNLSVCFVTLQGYLCCKRRVLEFDEFLKIQGCKTGRHVFVPRKTTAPDTEEVVNCRIDHYQTMDKVFVSVFAKQADKERSSIKFDSPEQVTLDIYLPGSKRFSRVLNLFGPIDPEQSTFRYFNTKVELQLQKSDKRGWVLLEKTTRDLGGINYTFGVGGRTGTIGGKELHLDAANRTRSP
ncbi:hypothetical protein D9756_001686 [Leucocoprinus leucothites]|uniref:Uncharacterized protein n=1 Tax=Leucocoprinus leucothites TaxID=201217 RepID=A0A8H5LHY5_9AGAR|nr:hypothetical protein D9756_001686 [Leucoagaricus leucothites]